MARRSGKSEFAYPRHELAQLRSPAVAETWLEILWDEFDLEVLDHPTSSFVQQESRKKCVIGLGPFKGRTDRIFGSNEGDAVKEVWSADIEKSATGEGEGCKCGVVVVES